MIKVVVNHNDIVHNFLGISSLANFERVIIVFSFLLTFSFLLSVRNFSHFLREMSIGQYMFTNNTAQSK